LYIIEKFVIVSCSVKDFCIYFNLTLLYAINLTPLYHIQVKNYVQNVCTNYCWRRCLRFTIVLFKINLLEEQKSFFDFLRVLWKYGPVTDQNLTLIIIVWPVIGCIRLFSSKKLSAVLKRIILVH
jgi:hypothetical protein